MAQDKKIVCKDCQKEFDFPASEQDFFKEKGFSDPIRCSDCRKKRRAEKQRQQYH